MFFFETPRGVATEIGGTMAPPNGVVALMPRLSSVLLCCEREEAIAERKRARPFFARRRQLVRDGRRWRRRRRTGLFFFFLAHAITRFTNRTRAYHCYYY
jgi:hypothetical protein